MMIDTDAPEHVRRRRLVSEGFTPGGSARARRASAPSATPSSTRVCEQGSADFVRDIAAPLPMIVIGNMLGVAPEDRDDAAAVVGRHAEVAGLARAASDGGGRWPRASSTPSYITAVTEQRRRAEAGRRPDRHPGPRRDRGGPPGRDIAHLRVAAHPHRWRRDDPPRHQRGHVRAAAPPGPVRGAGDRPVAAAAAVEEMLRWVTPIKNMARTMTRDVELHGETLEEGQKLLLLYPSANRDEAVFDRSRALRHRPHAQRPHGLRLRLALLPGQPPGPDGAQP